VYSILFKELVYSIFRLKKIITTELKKYKNSRKNTKIQEKIQKFKKKYENSRKKSTRDKKMKWKQNLDQRLKCLKMVKMLKFILFYFSYNYILLFYYW
jgi:membrane protein insertase Oxa1/YidC/SpoIIIJ